MIASGFSWFHLIPGVEDNTFGPLASIGFDEPHYVVFSTGMTVLAVTLFAGLAGMGVRKAASRQGMEKYLADESLTPRNVAELMAEFMLGFMKDAMPKHEVPHYFAFIASLFIYILFSNLQGLIPGFLPPTDNINANLGMALGSFLMFMWVGLSRDAVGFLKHLAGPVALLIPLMFPLEAFGLIVRPISLSLRLTGNMFGDHLVFDIMANKLMVPIVPSALLALAMFVSGMQAFIFALLSSVYIGLSLPHDDHH